MNQIDCFVKQAEVRYRKSKLKMRILQILVAAILLSTAFLARRAYGREEMQASIQEDIANEILRFHVLANSDSKADQEVKLKVKNEVVSYLQGKLSDCHSKAEAKQILAKEDGQVRQIATAVLLKNGYDYKVTSEISNVYFPVKQYGDLSFPAGKYDAYRILIGKAEGKNWWCVMFPSLCAVNETYSVVPDDSKERLKHVLTEEDYESIDTEYHSWFADALSKLF